MDLPLHELKVLLDDLKLLAEDRGIKGYKSMSEERLLSVLSKPKLIGNNSPSHTYRCIMNEIHY